MYMHKKVREQFTQDFIQELRTLNDNLPASQDMTGDDIISAFNLARHIIHTMVPKIPKRRLEHAFERFAYQLRLQEAQKLIDDERQSALAQEDPVTKTVWDFYDSLGKGGGPHPLNHSIDPGRIAINVKELYDALVKAGHTTLNLRQLRLALTESKRYPYLQAKNVRSVRTDGKPRWCSVFNIPQNS